jgi:hypothetical protein
MRFESIPLTRSVGDGLNVEPTGEHALYAVDPRQGNDSALLAVFDNPRSPRELASFLNWAYDAYLRDGAPMEPATETRISPGGSRHAEQSAYERASAPSQ